MQVMSVNVARVREITFRGERHKTGIFKEPVPGPVAVNPLGLQGDRQCDLLNHGGEHKAVYGFALDHYGHWREVLDNPGLGPGAFGENLTVSGLDEETICLGDQVAIGSVLLEVSQPRVPCFKLGVALDDERAPALFTRHFHTGVYFRVLEEGELKRGDGAEVIYRHPAALSVHRLFRAFYDRDYPDRNSLLTAAMKLEVLAPEWQHKLRTRR
ncbi:MOSC domain-containing protein [Seongchinamella sediminis]|uniref:MOSC domain-containing protein n=1 Tax=Seongchinamella sediminis TaxID=2283635 RepID=A0A3L7DW56_9GAMM|nr:MOSC domain-containing protein [Seongchinamella sediminis]RLQ20789.1 MOSC domain-containing protein [Seongchinamella sediminis]